MLEPGSIVAGYRIEGVLGRGGMGVVYEATQLSLDRRVALKVVAPHLSDDPEFGERFRREGLAQAQVGHPNIVPVHEAGESEAGLFLAMGLVHGTNLKQLIVDDRLDLRRTLYLLAQIADALDAAHSLGMVHRDVKPQNILVNHEYAAYLADFGLTKALGAKSLTKTGRVLGSLDYIAPEQIRGQVPTGRTDVYSFGAVLYECLTKEAPFPRDTDAALLFAHMTEPPPRLRVLRPDLAEGLEDVVVTAMAKDPAERYPTATAMIHAAEDATGVVVEAPTPAALLPVPTQSGGPSRVRRETTTVPTGTAPALRRALPRAPAALAAAALVVVVVAAGWLAGSSGSSTVVVHPPELGTGPLRLTAPGWTTRSAAGSLTGLRLRNPIAVGPAGARAAVLVAGTTDAGPPSFVPAAFRTRIGRGRGELVRLGRFPGLRLRKSGLTLYVVPTTRGVATIVCRDAGGAQCTRAAGTLRLVGASAYAPRLGHGYATAVGAVLARLGAARAHGVRGLRRAGLPGRQASAAASLAGAYRRAAGELRRLRTPRVARAASARLAADAARAAGAYARLAAAARTSDSRAYDAARRGVAVAERAAQRELANLSALA